MKRLKNCPCKFDLYLEKPELRNSVWNINMEYKIRIDRLTSTENFQLKNYLSSLVSHQVIKLVFALCKILTASNSVRTKNVSA